MTKTLKAIGKIGPAFDGATLEAASNGKAVRIHGTTSGKGYPTFASEIGAFDYVASRVTEALD